MIERSKPSTSEGTSYLALGVRGNYFSPCELRLIIFSGSATLTATGYVVLGVFYLIVVRR